MGTVRMYPEPTGEVRMSLSLRFAAGSHDGMIREHNEDSGYAGPRLLAVADGMGGQAAGEVASSEVISTIVQLDEDVPGSDLLTELGNAVRRANDQLRVMVEEDPQLEGMGTTLTALLWTGRRLGLVHVGDSRAYLLRDGRLTQITADHTWVQKLVDEGRITDEEATTHPQRSLLMRALGSGDHVEPDLSIREVRAGDRYLVCSDGLSGVVSHQTMEDTLAGYHGPQETVQELIQLALRGGGPDNITCIVADVLDVDAEDGTATQLNDTPVIVGAVAENQTQLRGDAHTPAARAAELGRGGSGPAVPPQQTPGQHGTPQDGGFGPPGSGHGPGTPPATGSFGSFTEDDFVKPRSRGRWIKRSLIIALVLAVLGGGVYAGWSWTQKQYYVGSNGDHVAVYRGISQELAGISLSSVHEDHPDVPLQYLTTFQRQRLEESITADDLAQAEEKIGELRAQTEACRLAEEQQKAREEQEKEQRQRQNDRNDGQGSGQSGGDRAGSPSDSQSSPSPSPGPSMSEKQRELAQQCTTP
ncbi:serine/threonine-protein phosphatase [Streptomyces sp. RKND-216]|uniref:PP2C family protein-serine/threonine phosphatase n=1 Tax=Streptomyces sp. RKND-216 TaxID=2562581 RepID=UPI00109DAA81|nr:PP2C family serine/threonine-protein phosphatase [Streptomyces sp. RKND-216]THA25443.1 serine/threonine-protein phosphatase [Streptomyces sp. RKND-216]